jgi:hypothetical protein
MQSFLIRLLLLISLVPSGVQAQTVFYPNGTFQDTDGDDFIAKNLPSKYYNELWTYHINLENGVQLIYTFMINDFGSFKDRATGVKLSVTWTDGNTYVVNKKYDPSTFITEPDNNYIRLHPTRPYWAKGSFNDKHRLFFHNTKEGVQYDLDLTLYDIAQGKTLGDGTYKVGNNELGIALLIPHAKVKGFVAINGDTLNVKGVGYMDHIYQNNLSSEIIDRSYRIKTGDAQNGMFFHFLSLKNSGIQSPIGYGVGYTNGIPHMLTPSQIERVSSDSKVHDLDTHVKIKPYQSEMLNIKVKKHMDTYSLLNELGGIKKFLAKQVIGGELIEMSGTVTINGDKPGYFYYMVAK